MPSSWSTCPPPRRPSGTVASHATEGVGAGHQPGGGLSSSPVRGRTLSGDTGGGFPSLPPRHVQIVGVDVDVAEILRPAGAGTGAPVVRVEVVVAGLGKDRKSVVEGQSGSVRVDLGGRRIIKKKT